MEQKRSGAVFPVSGGILLFTLIFGALFVTQKPFHVRRSRGILKYSEYSMGAGVPARLWQDPFAALEHGVRERKMAPDYPEAGHCLKNLADSISHCLTDGYFVDVVGIWVWGGPRSESVEWRIRCRYAALSALGAIGFRPDDAEHLGYVLFTPEKPVQAKPAPVPFEWFTHEGSDRRKVLLLWLDSEAFPGSAMDDICSIKSRLLKKGENRTRFMLIGPGSSNAFSEMIKWALSCQAHPLEHQCSLQGTIIYSPFATVDNASGSIKSLLRDGYDDPSELFRRAAGIEFVRTIHDDRLLANIMRQELVRRGINPARDKIALISEWDSVYASELMDTFQDVFDHDAAGSAMGAGGAHIFRYCYMRGLDGVVPGGSVTKDTTSHKKSADGKNANGNNGKTIEKSVGQSQYDYLRRMGKVLARQEQLRAVGVLGSDVYDKLLVLEALHDLLPDVVFFTTDLDARYFHPAYSNWSRNLVVVSSLGLELAPRYQKAIPPFRSVYQPSLFLAVQKALEFNGAPPKQRDFDLMLDRPRIFETGIGEAYDISGSDTHESTSVHAPAYSSTWLQRNTALMLWLALLLFLLPPVYLVFHFALDIKALSGNSAGFFSTFSDGLKALYRRGTRGAGCAPCDQSEECISSIPWQFWAASIIVIAGFMMLKCCLASDIYREPGWIGRSSVYIFLSFCIISFPLFFLMSAELLKPDRFRPGLSLHAGQSDSVCTHLKPRESDRLVWKFWVGIVLSTAFAAICLYDVVSRQLVGGEPFVLLGGISIWPSTFLLIFAGILAIFFLYRSSYTLETNICAIPGRFCERCGIMGEKAHECLNADWYRYVRRCRPAIRLGRIFVLWFGYFLAAWMLVRLDKPFIPFRGEASFIMNSTAVAISALPMMFLVLWVADVTKMCSRLAEDMLARRNGHALWCSNMTASRGCNLENSPGVSSSWFNISLIAHHSEAIAHMVYFPLAVIIIMLLARLSCFDRTDTPLGLAIVIMLTMTHAVIWPARLRRVAERFRRQVLDEFHQALIRAKSREDEVEAGQLQEMIRYVTTLDKGAFSPISRQPWVHVVMTMFGGGGGYALLTYLGI